MQYNQLTAKERRDKAWTRKRNALVNRLLKRNPRLLSFEALRQANAIINAQEKRPHAKR